jgi:hypothetical protein
MKNTKEIQKTNEEKLKEYYENKRKKSKEKIKK